MLLNGHYYHSLYVTDMVIEVTKQKNAQIGKDMYNGLFFVNKYANIYIQWFICYEEKQNSHKIDKNLYHSLSLTRTII